MFPFSLSFYLQFPLWVVILYATYRVCWDLTKGIDQKKKAKERGCEPPTNRPSRFFALNLIYWQSRFMREHTVLQHGHEEFYEFARTYLVYFFGQAVFATNEPANVQSILATDFSSWKLGDNRKPLIRLLGEGIFSSDGAAWRHSRDLLRPNFNRAQIADVGLFEKHIKYLLRAIPRDGSTIDLQPLFFRLSMDVSTEFLFDQSTNDLAAEHSSPETIKFVEAWDRCTDIVGGGKGILGLFVALNLGNTQFKRDCKTVHAFADNIVAKYLSKRSADKSTLPDSAQRYVFLDELVEQTSDPAKIRTELLNVLLAGRETIASLLSNLIFTLARRPDVQARLRAEIDGLGNLEYETVKNLRYLRAFINESLRLYPTVPLNGRQAAVDTVLPTGGGPDQQSPVSVPKGALAGWNLYSMHRRKDIYGEDAEEFRPERWLDEEGKKGVRPGWAFLPFNGGPRICIGQQFALAETSYIVIRLLQEFSSIDSRDPEPWRENMKLTCTGAGGCKVAVTPRV